MDIKETKEIIEGMGEAAVTGKKLVVVVKKILEGGISATDIVHLNELISVMPDTAKIEAAIKDADVALEEMKDLDQAEVVEILGDLYAQADRFNKA